uniref:trypsin n=1 Tax=Mola mola TaxID=94237 RepID=A0A3Q4B1P9_MOLML
MKLKLLFVLLLLAVLLILTEVCIHFMYYTAIVIQGETEMKTLLYTVCNSVLDFFYEIVEVVDDEEEDDGHLEWLYDLQEPMQRKPLPQQWGVPSEKQEKMRDRGLCGRGECVLTSSPPYYECKCKAPFQPPDCRTFSVCQPDPCKNGGTCVADGNDFDCQCPPGYRGRFCHVGPDDCYLNDGESYRGNVTETENGDECLQWNSHFIVENRVDPFKSMVNKEGLGPHNFCRNPDGDQMPWCFFRRGPKLFWNYCDVLECSDSTDVVPMEMVPPAPTTARTRPKPRPTARPVPKVVTTKSPPIQKPSEAPPAIPSLPRQFSGCGKAQPKRPITRIFGGLKVNPGGIPWQVSLQVRPKSSNQIFKHVCGGVLIDSCWVLTAGHCIEPNKDMQVVMGGLSLDTDEPADQIIRVAQAMVHENYRETLTAVYNDIALLRLKESSGVCATETQFVKAACLPEDELPDATECTISGWGATEESSLGSNHLLKANVLLINHGRCSEESVYGRVLDISMVCAGHLQGGVDSCQGDSGGPLTCNSNSTSFVYGLVSWGDQCGRQNKPGVYTRVNKFMDWIKSKTQGASP